MLMRLEGVRSYLHVFLSDVSHLEQPPGLDGHALHGQHGQEVAAALAEEAELARGAGLVHQVDVLVAPDAEQTEAYN